MEVLNIDTNQEQAAQILREGGVILYPTDTLYWLGADAFSDDAVHKIYEIKGRDPQKPIHAIFADVSMIERYAELNDVARALIKKFLPGALTLILKKKDTVQGGIARDRETIGVRIPNNSFCIEVAQIYGAPYTATSANLAGERTEDSVKSILKQLGDRAVNIDAAFDGGVQSTRVASTVVDLSGETVRILRESAISAAQIYAEL